MEVSQGRCSGWPAGPLVSGDVSPGLQRTVRTTGSYSPLITVYEPAHIPTMWWRPDGGTLTADGGHLNLCWVVLELASYLTTLPQWIGSGENSTAKAKGGGRATGYRSSGLVSPPGYMLKREPPVAVAADLGPCSLNGRATGYLSSGLVLHSSEVLISF